MNQPGHPASEARADAGPPLFTLPTWITLFRFLLIPAFVFVAVHYGRTVRDGPPDEWLRHLAIGIFVLASVSDFLDGYLARRLNLRSRLGALLDPLADKGLLITALITLTFSGWNYEFPLWFTVLVISRDLFILAGYGLLHMALGTIPVRPTLLGKLATASLMIALAWVMLQIPHHTVPVLVAGLITLASAVDYLLAALRILKARGDTP